MADFEIERPSVELNQVNPTFNVNPPQFTIEIHGSIQGQRGEKGDKGDTGEPGRDGIDGINGIDGVDGEDGVGVESIVQTSTSHESGGTNIITATLTDGTETTFEIMNGEAGSAAAEIIDISDEINYIGAQYQPPTEPPQGLWGVKGITDGTIIGKLNTLKQKILAGEITDFVFYHNPSYNYWGPYHSECYFHINNIAFYEDDYVTLVISCSFDWENGMAHNINDTVEVHYNGSEDSWSVCFYRKDIQNILESEINTKQNKIDSSHKLSSDLVDDTNKTNKFVTASEKTTWSGKQDALVSGTNIKTINNESLLGSGNINIQGTGTDVQINGSSIVSNDVANIQVKGTYNSSTNKIATMSEIPTKVSDLSNDSGFISSETDPIFTASDAYGITSSDITNWNGKSDFSGSYNDLTDKPSLFSGDYTDLTNKPTIPDELSDLTDDSTHRLVTDSEKTTWSGKQDALVSGTNIKTINNTSLLGSGNITISGGGTATDVQINGASITSEGVANILTETAYSSSNKIATVSDLPTKVSDLTNDSNFISGLVMLTYDSSTWQDFQNAYNSNKVVYCKVGGRMAFLAYVEASKVEFQYYRSLGSPTVSSQPDEVYVYSLTSASVWSTTTRKASSTIAVGTGLSRSYTANSRTMTLSVDTSTMAQKSDLPTKTSDLTNDSGFITGYTETDPVFSASAAHGITSTDITNWNNKSNFSGSYNDLTNKPTIPTVNNATLTIQKNGTTVKTFTANASSNVTANITVPTKTSDITNDSGFVTSSSLAAVATSGSYSDLTNKPTIPTKTSDLQNDQEYIAMSDLAFSSTTWIDALF